MTKGEYLEHLCDVINGVFRAKDAISQVWQPKLMNAIDNASQEERSKIAQDYIRAIAQEMLEGYLRSGHTMEELTKSIIS